MPSEKNRWLAYNLRKFRLLKGMSQKDFSEFLGVPQSNIATWERGEIGITNKNLRNIAEKLDISIDALLTGAAPENGLKDEPRIIPVTFRKLPVVSWTTAGIATSYEDLANQIDELVDSTTKDPNAFAVEVIGDSMEGEVHSGDWVVLEPNREASSGDMAYVRLTDEAGGGGTLKWFYRTGSAGRVGWRIATR